MKPAPIDPVAILESVYPPGTLAHRIMLDHARRVADKAVAVARGLPHLRPDIDFIREAALIHDIGVCKTRSPKLGCGGSLPYVCHGIMGRAMMADLGWPRHGLVCERHVGVGITREDIARHGLPLPDRDMRPVTLEEEIVAYADKFYSKKPGLEGRCKSPDEIIASLTRWGEDKIRVFRAWRAKFEPDSEG